MRTCAVCVRRFRAIFRFAHVCCHLECALLRAFRRPVGPDDPAVHGACSCRYVCELSLRLCAFFAVFARCLRAIRHVGGASCHVPCSLIRTFVAAPRAPTIPQCTERDYVGMCARYPRGRERFSRVCAMFACNLSGLHHIMPCNMCANSHACGRPADPGDPAVHKLDHVGM